MMNNGGKKSSVKVCVVCGDKANGYNFNAISCESCKAFFRRNALRKKVYKCTFNKSCEINVVSRKFCQKCRLQKCLDQGMNKNLILSDEEKKLMKYKVSENRQKKCFNISDDKNSVITSSKSQSSGNESLTMHSSYDKNFMVNKFLLSCQQQPSNQEQVNCGNHMVGMGTDNNQDTFSQVTSKSDKWFLLKNFDNIFYEESNDKKIKVNTIARLLEEESRDECKLDRVMTFTRNKGLNAVEQQRMDELTRAFSHPCQPPTDAIPVILDHRDILRVIEMNIQRLIKIVKRIECFRNLCLLDQTALMRAGCTQINILRSVKAYNYQNQTWSYKKNGMPKTVMTMDVFKHSATPTVYEAHKRFMNILAHEWDQDTNILNLLSMIILFTGNRPDIIHNNLIAFEYHSYKYLLNRYLETKYKSKHETIEKFCKLINILKELHFLNEETVRWHLEADPQNIGPLLLEIFDLKI